MKFILYKYIEIRFSCAYWLLSVICLLDSHLSKCCVSHRQQISRLSNRMIAPSLVGGRLQGEVFKHVLGAGRQDQNNKIHQETVNCQKRRLSPESGKKK